MDFLHMCTYLQDYESQNLEGDANYSRRGLIKQKITRYMNYAEDIYNKHLRDSELNLLAACEQQASRAVHCAIPLSMVRRPYEELAMYRVLAVLGRAAMLVLHEADQTCYAMKVIQKIPHNLTDVDEYFMQPVNETRKPVLPTVIPYMVQLHAFVETSNLIFLILSYAPGEKLFDYIKNYAKSVPNTPAREVNLENVFTEPKNKTSDITDVENNVEVGTDAVDSAKVTSEVNERLDNSNNSNVKDSCDNVDVSVNELVLNSQKLLMNVDKALSSLPSISEVEEDKTEAAERLEEVVRREVETTTVKRLTIGPRELLPPSAVCRWGAEILTALESLHNCGVICRDLNPSNILLGDKGQVILTYFLDYPGGDLSLAKLCARDTPDLYVAPELYNHAFGEERDAGLERVCDYWSFGAVMYQLLCGVPLSHYHRTVFTSHTILQLPDGLPVEVQSLLTQLLTYEPSSRLGAGADGVNEIKNHPYFRHIDWQTVYDSWALPG